FPPRFAPADKRSGLSPHGVGWTLRPVPAEGSLGISPSWPRSGSVATGVVEDGSGYRSHVGGWLREPHAPGNEPLMLGDDVVDCERRERNAVVHQCLLERPRRRVL